MSNTYPNADAAELERAKRILEAGKAIDLSQPHDTSDAGLEKLVNSGVENVDALLAEARERLALAPVPKATDNKREAPNADILNMLLAKAAELKRTADSATKERGKITDLIAEIAGPVPKKVKEIELTVNGATVFTVQQVVSRVLNTDFVKSKHPDIEGNEDYYKDSISTRRNYK